MTTAFCVYGFRTGIIREGDSLVDALLAGICQTEASSFRDGDVVVLAETAVATAEGSVVDLASVVPCENSLRLGDRYGIDPRLVEVVTRESDEVVGGIPGHLLCMKGGTLLPNAGVDASNAPAGCVTPLPADPDGSARAIRQVVEQVTGAKI
ncbi:MAG: coenzyme F420-0:L-glutamate ligase, partial [Methanoregulaceae archaeon]|nr:coenzyme F420-0:L-glutamate ligase [Methanoregulaceae archaeon]